VLLFTAGCKKNTNDGGVNRDSDQNASSVTISPTQTDNQAAEPTTPLEDTSHEGQMRSYLSGQWVPVEVGTKRPWAFVFNNFKVVSNQSAIGQADIVYEGLVEGGITRLLGIGENYSGDRIGSTRSARHYFVSIADEYDAIFIHYGKTKYATSKMNELGIDHMDGSAGIGNIVFYRDNSIKAPHNAFASVEGIEKGIKEKGFEIQYKEGYESHFNFYEEDSDLPTGTAAVKINVDFSSYNSPYFEYSDTDKLYYRFQFGAPHIDSLTGNQLTFKNIIIQFVKEWNIDKNGYQTMDLEDASGSGYYITNGKMVPITWKKKEANHWMRYYNEAGEELTINPGKTFIALFPDNRTKDVVVK
jgi:hypothetical protein